MNEYPEKHVKIIAIVNNFLIHSMNMAIIINLLIMLELLFNINLRVIFWLDQQQLGSYLSTIYFFFKLI